jgi:hypothetical protein
MKTQRTMKPEFEFYELVEVRDHDDQEWQKRCLLWVLPDNKGYWCIRQGQDITNCAEDQHGSWNQIRKIQPEPQLEEQTPEQDTNTYFYLHDRIQGLSRRIDKLESELNLHSVT